MLSIAEKVLFLKSVALFAELPGRELASVAAVARERDFAANKVIMEEGKAGGSLYLVVEGEALVSRDGKELARRSSGECIGEISVLDDEPRTATVIACNNMVVLEVMREDLDSLLAERPEIARGIIRTLVKKLAEASSS